MMNKATRAKILSFGLMMTLLGSAGCGATTDEELTRPMSQEVPAGSPDAPELTKTSTPATPLKDDQEGNAQTASAQCCYTNCKNDGSSWRGPWKLGRPGDGHCRSVASYFCYNFGYRYYSAYWDPCR